MPVIKTVLHGIKMLIISVGVLIVSILFTLIIIWVAKEIIIPKELSEIEGVWLAHDGDEKLYGKLKLNIVGDSAYFGSRAFADGRPDSLYSVCAKMHLTKDSLLLSTKYNRSFQAWGLESLDGKQLVLKGDSYLYHFIRQGTAL